MRARLVAFAFFGSSFSFSFSTCSASFACVTWWASPASEVRAPLCSVGSEVHAKLPLSSVESEVRARGEFAPLA